jgi:hypothetical protein
MQISVLVKVLKINRPAYFSEGSDTCLRLIKLGYDILVFKFSVIKRNIIYGSQTSPQDFWVSYINPFNIREEEFMATKEWQHNPIAQKAGAPAAAGDPGSYVWVGDKTQHIVYLGLENQVHELWLRKGQDWRYGGALSMTTGGQMAGGDPDGYAWEGDQTQHIIYRGQDNQIHELWQRKGAEWKYGGALSARVGAPLAVGNLSGFVWEKDQTQHIIYRGPDNGIHEIWQRKGAEWKYGGSLNQQVGAPATAGDPFGFVWEEDQTQHVVYRGADNQIHELWYRKKPGWSYEGAMTLKLGAPAAGGDPVGYVWKADKSQHILYRGLENQVQELWYRQKSGWAYGGALSAKAGGPPAAGNPAGYAWEVDDTQHVVYRGQDSQIHELWQRRGKEWKYGGALNVNTGGPVAAGDPDGFAWEEDETQHIVYRGQDNQIHELWQRK